MKSDVILMTLSSLLIWGFTALRWVTAGLDAVTVLLLYLCVGALHGLTMCSDLHRARETDRGTALILWVTQTLIWLPWNLQYATHTLTRIFRNEDRANEN